MLYGKVVTTVLINSLVHKLFASDVYIQSKLFHRLAQTVVGLLTLHVVVFIFIFTFF